MYDVYRTSHNHCNDLLTNRQSTVVESKFLRMRTMWRENSRRCVLTYIRTCIYACLLDNQCLGRDHLWLCALCDVRASASTTISKACSGKGGWKEKWSKEKASVGRKDTIMPYK